METSQTSFMTPELENSFTNLRPLFRARKIARREAVDISDFVFDIYLPVLSSLSSINAFFASIGLTEVLKLRGSIQVFFENRMASALATRSNEWTAKDLNLSFSVSRFGQTSLNLHMRNN